MKKHGLRLIFLGIIILACTLATYEIILEKIRINKIKNIENQEEIEVIPYNGINETITQHGFDYTPYSMFDNVTYNTSTLYTKEFGLHSYEVNDNIIYYEINAGLEVTVNIYLNNQLIYTGAYLSGDKDIDIAIAGDNIVTYNYNDKGELYSLAVNDGLILEKEDDNNNTLALELNNETDRSYLYSNNKVISETIGTLSYSYNYDINDKLICDSPKDLNAYKTANEIEIEYDGDTYKYIFEHTYNGKKYVTESYKNGELTGKYSYINDLVISKEDRGIIYTYVIDNSGNYIGTILDGEFYLFIYDTNGRIYSLINTTNNNVIYIDSTAYGQYNIINDKYELIKDNCVIYPGKLVDTTNGFIINNEEIIIPSQFKKITYSGDVTELSSNESFVNNSTSIQINDLTAMTLFKEKIVDEVIKRFETNGLQAESYVGVKDEANTKYMIADIYTLDYADSKNSIQNVINGNQVYKIIYQDENSILNKTLNKHYVSLFDEIRLYYSNHSANYSLNKGSMNFNGQFIYLGYLITYRCLGDGIISYTLSENKVENYRTWNSIYNYDTGKYSNYSEIQFNESLWEYTTIIPGMNREQYEVVEYAIQEVTKLEGIATQKQLEYFDSNYLNSAEINQIGDTLKSFDISEEQMIVLKDDGSLKVQYLPFFDNPQNIKNLIKAGGLIVGCTIVGIVCAAIPGFQVVVPIVCCALKGIATSLIATTLIKTVSFVIQTDWSNWQDIDMNQFLSEYLSDAVNSMYIGAATGALFGAIKLGVSNKITNYRLNRVDKKFANLLPEDDMYGTMQYERMKLTINRQNITFCEKVISTRTKDLLVEVSTKIPTSLAFNYGMDKLGVNF